MNWTFQHFGLGLRRSVQNRCISYSACCIAPIEPHVSSGDIPRGALAQERNNGRDLFWLSKLTRGNPLQIPADMLSVGACGESELQD